MHSFQRSSRNKALLLASAASAFFIANAAQAQQAAPSGAAAVEEVVVTGTRLTAAGFNAPTPVTVLGADALQKRAPNSMAEAVNELPAFRSGSGPTTVTRLIGGAGQVSADLRGLGTSRTLVMVNGRRYIGSQLNGTADMAQIPTGLVERVDVVTGGASAAYGSDAVAGVVNFVLNTKLQGWKGSLQYGLSQHNDAIENVANLAYGKQIGDRLHIMIGADYARDKGTGNFYDRDYMAKAEVDQVSYGATRAANLPAQGWLAGTEIPFTEGGIVVSGPLKGTAFTNAGDPYLFNYGTVYSSTRMVGSNANYGHNGALVFQMYKPFERLNSMAAAQFDVTPDIKAFVEINKAYNRNDGGTGDIVQSTAIITPITNPFIPASVKNAMTANKLTSISIGRFNNDISPWTTYTQWYTNRAVAGLNGTFHDWKWEASYSQGATHQKYKAYMTDNPDFAAATYVVADASGNPVCGPAATNPNITAAQIPIVEPGCVPFNVFGQKNSQAAIDYVTGFTQGINIVRQKTAGFNVSGSPYVLPAGEVSLAAGVEWRKDAVSADADPRGKLNAWGTQNQATYTGENSVKEGFVEIGVPLLKDAPFAKSLDLNGAARRTDYQSSGAVTTWKVGATWEPTDYLRFRATQSRDIRAPNISELYSTGSSGGTQGSLNPFTGVLGRINTQSGGNAKLTPEIADSLTAGIIFQPHWGFTQGFKASVDYYHITITDVISTVATNDAVLRCFAGDKNLCSTITFDNTTFGIALVKSVPLNFAVLETEGIDIELAYRIPLESLPLSLPGTLNVRNLTTIVSKLASDDGKVRLDKAGFSVGGVDKMTGNATLDYSLNKLNVGLQARYFGDLRWDPTLVGPDSPFYNPKLTNSISRNLFPGQVLFNGNFSYDIVKEEGRKLQVFATVNNIFDRHAPLEGATAFIINGVQYYDLIGRYFRTGLRFAF